MGGSTDKPARLAVILLRLPDGRFVMQRRTADAPIAAGKLGLFGGHIEDGESDYEAMTRELAEETSLDVPSLDITELTRFVMPASTNYGADRDFVIFKADIPSDDFEVFEGDGAESYDLEAALARDDLSEATRRVLQDHVR